eukprot:scaffold36520_cov19-Tisochrysis_lutea.AAC.2
MFNSAHPELKLAGSSSALKHLGAAWRAEQECPRGVPLIQHSNLQVTTQPLCARVQHGERSKTFPLGTPLMSSAQACRQSLVAGGQPRAKQWVHCTHESRTPQPASPTPCPLICKGSNLSDEFPSHFGAPFDSGGHTLYDRVLKSRGSTGPAMDRPC